VQHAFGLRIPQTVEEACQPSRTALLVYDMQVGVLNQIEDAGALVARVERVLAAARGAGVRVVFVRHMTLPPELTGVKGLRMAMAWQRLSKVEDVRSAFPAGSPQYQLTPELTPGPAEAVFDKITMSALEGTPLDIVLRDCGITTILVAGVATEVGIDPTVRHAADLGYLPVIVTDACAAGDRAAGERALRSLAFAGDTLFTDTATLEGILRAPRAPD
jgi:nicotinamidase-related amidase